MGAALPDYDRRVPQLNGRPPIPSARDGRRPKAAELVAWEIARRIVNGELREADSLPLEPELMAAYGVSRPTLREAMRLLETQGFISIGQGQHNGARVRVPDLDHASVQTGLLFQIRKVPLKDIVDAWVLLEPKVVATLAVHHPKDALSKLRTCLTQVEGEVHPEFEALTHRGRFHQMLHDLNENSALGSILGILRRVVELHFEAAITAHKVIPEIEYTDDVHSDHAAFLALLEARDAVGAEDFWRMHIEPAGKALIAEFGADSVVVLPE